MRNDDRTEKYGKHSLVSSMNITHMSLRDQLISMFTPPSEFEMVDGKRMLKRGKTVEPDGRTSEKRHVPILTLDAVKFLLAIKKAKLMQKNVDWQPKAIPAFSEREFKAALTELILDPNVEKGIPVRKQWSFNIQQHFMAMEVEAYFPNGNDANLRLVVIDGSADPKFRRLLYSNFKNFFPELYIITGVFLHSAYACGIVTINIMSQLRKIPNLFEILAANADKDGNVHYSKLPLPLIKTMQGLSDIEKYDIDQGTVFNKKGDTLATYISKHRGYFKDDKPDYERNFSVLDLYLKYASEAMKVLALLDDKQLQNVIEGMPLPIDDTLLSQPLRSPGK